MKWVVRLGRSLGGTPLVIIAAALLFAAAGLAISPANSSIAPHSTPQSASFPFSRGASIPKPRRPKATHVLGAQTERPINCRQVPCLALTFDDGPNPVTTPQILATLERYQVHASFFVIGIRVVGNVGLLSRMHADGDEIGSHTWNHSDLTTLTPPQIVEQFELSALAIEDSGAPAPTSLRPPYGAVNQSVIASLPVPLAMWNEDPKDWQASGPDQVVQAVEATARPGGVIDLHDIYRSTADALPQIITDLSARGYHFVTFTQMVQLDPSAHTEYYGLKSP